MYSPSSKGNYLSLKKSQHFTKANCLRKLPYPCHTLPQHFRTYNKLWISQNTIDNNLGTT